MYFDHAYLFVINFSRSSYLIKLDFKTINGMREKKRKVNEYINRIFPNIQIKYVEHPERHLPAFENEKSIKTHVEIF